jgi:hypothetical protein
LVFAILHYGRFEDLILEWGGFGGFYAYFKLEITSVFFHTPPLMMTRTMAAFVLVFVAFVLVFVCRLVLEDCN